MFERFTERARKAVTLAQDEAEQLRHGHIGTEHLLLGLLRDEQSVAARVLASFELTEEQLRASIVRRVPPAAGAPTSGHMPFTPRAKKSLELALRESQDLGHNYIGSEHILLGLAATDDGQAAAVLRDFGLDHEKVRQRVIEDISGGVAAPLRPRSRWRRGRVAGPMLDFGFRVEPDSELLSVLMAAAARALEDGRTAITIDDVRIALARRPPGAEPPEAASGA